jgi:hypothetical protein
LPPGFMLAKCFVDLRVLGGERQHTLRLRLT